jgi:hypothetical protein
VSIEAIFLHSGWRSAGTWIWNAFREHPETMAFYEPLHETLAGVTLDGLTEIGVDSWDSKHALKRPYFEEYAPLLRPRKQGIPGFDRSFTFDRYFTPPQANERKLYAYLSSLLQLAQASGKMPVLKFCRSLGRVGWMRHHFPQAAHIAVVRDPLAQWASSHRLATNGNAYFLAAPLAILVQHAVDPLVKGTLSSLGLRVCGLRRSTFKKSYPECERFVALASLPTLYRSFVAFWLVAACKTLPYVDATIDSDLLTTSPAYRYQLQDDLRERSGIRLDLEAALAPPAKSGPAGLARSEVERVHEDALATYELLAKTFEEPRVERAGTIIRRKLETDRNDEREGKHLAASFDRPQQPH